MVKLPIVKEAIYPKELLDNLEQAIENNNQIYTDYRKNKSQLDNLKRALEPVLEIWEESLTFPEIEIDFEKLQPGTTVKKVKLDIRAELLILKCIRLQQKLIEMRAN